MEELCLHQTLRNCLCSQPMKNYSLESLLVTYLDSGTWSLIVLVDNKIRTQFFSIAPDNGPVQHHVVGLHLLKAGPLPKGDFTYCMCIKIYIRCQYKYKYHSISESTSFAEPYPKSHYLKEIKGIILEFIFFFLNSIS